MGRRRRPRPVQRNVINLQTVFATVVGVHHTDTVDKTWSASTNEKRLPSPMPVSTARKFYAWYDAEQVADGELPKAAGKFPHHEVSADGTPGAANLAACRNGLARLDSADIPEGDRDGVRRHLQAHLDDADSGTDNDGGGALPRAKNRARGEVRASRDWYKIRNFVEAPDTAAIYLYDEIGYWGVTAQDFVRDLMGLRVSNIVLHVNSPGGDVFDGLAIYHALRDHPATVESRVDGLAASAASFIAMAADKVVMQRNAQMMIHDASGICIGNATDMQKMTQLLDDASDNIADIYVQQAGGTVEQWRAAMREETWYTGAEALAAGLCDEVANADQGSGEGTAVVPGEDEDEELELMNRGWDLSIYTYAGREKAPAPRPLADLAAADEPDEPGDNAADEVDEPVSEPDDAPAADTEPEPEPASAIEAEPPGDEPGDDVWAAMASGLLQNATPSTVDELFAALQKEGNPA